MCDMTGDRSISNDIWSPAASNLTLPLLLNAYISAFFSLSQSDIFYLSVVGVDGYCCIRSHRHTHINSVVILWISDRPVAETATSQHATHNRQTKMYLAGFEPAFPDWVVTGHISQGQSSHTFPAAGNHHRFYQKHPSDRIVERRCGSNKMCVVAGFRCGVLGGCAALIVSYLQT